MQGAAYGDDRRTMFAAGQAGGEGTATLSRVSGSAALLSAEVEECERNVVQRRIRDAHLPRLKTLEDFDFSQSPKVPATQLHIEVPGGASGDHRWSFDRRWSPAELWL